MMSSENLLRTLVDGVWASWTTWSECSVSCGYGEQLRVRVCIGPLYGGHNCSGLDTDRQTCHEIPCPGAVVTISLS